MTDPLAVIKALNDISSLDGKCYEVYRLLKVVFPQAEGWHDEQHVITEINGKFYDRTGEVTHRPYLPDSVEPIDRRFNYRCGKDETGVMQ